MNIISVNRELAEKRMKEVVFYEYDMRDDEILGGVITFIITDNMNDPRQGKNTYKYGTLVVGGRG